jgi:Co/Zn/Cd efflux system component
VTNGNNALANSLALLAQSGNALEDAITSAISSLGAALTWLLDPELYYSYGQSPPVYPTRKCFQSNS